MNNYKKYADRIVKGSFIFIIVSIIAFNIITVIQGKGFASIDILAMTLLFLLAYTFSERLMNEKFYLVPSAFYYIAIIFAFFSTYLGSFLNFYEKFEIWDDVLHFVSGILLGILCIILTSFVVFKRFGKITKKPDILFMVVVGVLVSISIAVFWEFYECAFDFVVDGNMQRSLIITDPANFDPTPYMRPSGRFVDPGLMDTMGDFFQAVSGAILAGIYCFVHYAIIGKNIEDYNIEGLINENKANEKSIKDENIVL